MQEQPKQLEINLDKLIIRVHNKIAIWNNEDCSQAEKTAQLKMLSHDLVTDILSSAFEGLEGVKTREISLPREKKKSLFSFLKK